MGAGWYLKGTNASQNGQILPRTPPPPPSTGCEYMLADYRVISRRDQSGCVASLGTLALSMCSAVGGSFSGDASQHIVVHPTGGEGGQR